jgi:hypothetical protein
MTSTQTSTPSNTASVSGTQTPSQTASFTMTGTPSQTASITSSHTPTPSTSPLPLQILSIEQTVVDSNGTAIGRMGFLGQGYRFYVNGAFPVLSAAGITFSNITIINGSFFSADVPLVSLYWSNAVITLHVLGYTTTFTKSTRPPFDALVVAPMHAPYGDLFTITAPFIGTTPIEHIQLQDVAHVHASVSDTTEHSVSFFATLLRDEMFSRPLQIIITYVNNSAPIYLPSGESIFVDRPTLTNLHPALGGQTRKSVTFAFSLSASLPVAESWVSAGLSAPTKWNATRSFVAAVSSASGPSHGDYVIASSTGAETIDSDGTVRTASLLNISTNCSGGCSTLEWRAPEIYGTTGDYILGLSQTGSYAPSNQSFYILGNRLGTSDNPRITTLRIGVNDCPALVTLNDTTLVCSGWNAADSLIVWEDSVVDVYLPIVGTWNNQVITAAHSQRVVMGATITSVYPLLVDVGTRILMVGTRFLSLHCSFCSVEPMLFVSQIPCDSFVVLSDTAAECYAPAVPLDSPGYPVAQLAFRSAAGFFTNISDANTTKAKVTYVGQVSVEWAEVPSTPLQTLPSGIGDAKLLALSPAPVLLLSGTGTLSCWMDIAYMSFSQTVQNAGVPATVTLVGQTTAKVEVSGATPVVFNHLGVNSPSGADVSIVGRCTDSAGVRIDTSQWINVTIPSMTANWTAGVQAAYEIVLPPLQAPLAPAVITVDSPLSQVHAANATSLLSCAAIIVPAGIHVLSSLPVSDFTTQAISTEGEDPIAGVTNDRHTTWALAFDQLSLNTADLGGKYILYAECTWSPTGERMRLTAQNIEIVDASVHWNITASGNNTEYLFFKHSYNTSFAVAHNAPPSSYGSVQIPCRLTSLAGTGLTMNQQSSSTHYLTLQRVVSSIADLQMEGSITGSATLAMVCSIWQRNLQSQAITILARGIVIEPIALPTLVVPSDVHAGAPLWPPLQLLARDTLGVPIQDVSCALTSSIQGSKVRYTTSDTTIVPGPGGMIYVSDAFVQTQTYPSGKLNFTLTCKRPNGDDPAPVVWEATIVTLGIDVSIYPESTSDAQGLIPDWALVIGINIPMLPDSRASIMDMLSSESAVVCKAEIVTISTSVNDTFAYVQHGSVAMNASGIALFSRFGVTGRRGNMYTVSTTCGIGNLAFGRSFVFQVQLMQCQAGTVPQGLVCDPCPENSYTLGHNEAECIACPPVGVSCAGGLLTLLPDFFRPPDENKLPITATTELHTCYNTEACYVNASALDYSCTVGYTGPLCSVCDAANDYSMYGAACRKCWPIEASQTLLAMIVILFVALVGYLGLRPDNGPKSESSIALRILMGYLQALNGLQVFKAGGTKSFRDAMGWTQSVSDSPMSQGPLQCLLRWPFLIRFVGTILIPAFAAVGVVAMVAFVLSAKSIRARPKCTWDKERFSHTFKSWLQQKRHSAALILFLFLSYMPIIGTSFRALDCYDRPIAGVYWVRADMTVVCNSYEHVVIRLLASIVIVVFGVGFPVSLFYMLKRASAEKLKDDGFQRTFSFLFDGYKTGAPKITSSGHKKLQPKLVWWESIVLLRKAGVVCLAVLLSNPFYQVVGALLLFAGFMVLQQIICRMNGPSSMRSRRSHLPYSLRQLPSRGCCFARWTRKATLRD